MTTNTCIDYGTLVDNDSGREYHVASEPNAPMAASPDTIPLSTFLGSRPGSFPRANRLYVASLVAYSHAQLHSTGWLKPEWSLKDVKVPVSCPAIGNGDVYDYPCLHSAFSSPQTHDTRRPDQSFRSLGIVLLELCFGVSFDSHPRWNDSPFAQKSKDPLLRQAVALDWAREVELEAGRDYATAVDWCLQKSPIIVQDHDWRAEFVENVVQPLQKCYDSMPRKRI